MDEKKSLEDNGSNLLASWKSNPGEIKFKFPIAPDVKRGDAVYLSTETGQYEKVSATSDFHGLFNGHDVVILVTINDKVLPLVHSPIDGQMTPGVWKTGEE